jgi:hypothetical protein
MADENADQGEAQSAIDRIYSKFEPNEPEPEKVEAQADSDESEAEEQAPQEEVAEIEYDGERYQVPKKLEKAFLQEADYTRKTQEVAKQRQVLEQSSEHVRLMRMEAEFHNSAAEKIHNLRTLDNYITSLESQDIRALSSDEKADLFHTVRQAERQRDRLKGELENDREQFQAQFRKALDEARPKVHELLSKEIKGYSADAFKAAREYGKSKGFEDAVLDSIESDPRAAQMVYKAMLYDKLQTEKVSAVRRLDAPVIKPGSAKPMPQEVKDKLNYKKALNSAKTRDERNAIVQKRVESIFG